MTEIILGPNGTHSVFYFVSSHDPMLFGCLDYLENLYFMNWTLERGDEIENFAGSSSMLPSAKISFIDKTSGETGATVDVGECKGMDCLTDFLRESLRKKGINLNL